MASNRAAKRARRGEFIGNTLMALVERRGWTSRKYGLDIIAKVATKERCVEQRFNRLTREARRPDLFPNAAAELVEAQTALEAVKGSTHAA